MKNYKNYIVVTIGQLGNVLEHKCYQCEYEELWGYIANWIKWGQKLISVEEVV